MATIERTREPTVAEVDTVIDENASPVELPEDSALRVATKVEQTVGATGPTNWWRLSLIGIGIVAALLLGLQLLNGNTGTAMVPGTPTAAPASEVVGQ